MTWQQFLTEKVLKECWHDGRTPFNCGFKCRKCGNTFTTNRTFDNRGDMMDLYEAVWKDGRWDSLEDHLFNLWYSLWTIGKKVYPFHVWRFCLSGEDYEQNCKMVAEFYGWKEADHD